MRTIMEGILMVYLSWRKHRRTVTPGLGVKGLWLSFIRSCEGLGTDIETQRTVSFFTYHARSSLSLNKQRSRCHSCSLTSQSPTWGATARYPSLFPTVFLWTETPWYGGGCGEVQETETTSFGLGWQHAYLDQGDTSYSGTCDGREFHNSVALMRSL